MLTNVFVFLFYCYWIRYLHHRWILLTFTWVFESSFVFRHICSAFLHCLFILWTAVDFLQNDFCLPVFLLTFSGAISSITFLTFELNESRRRSTVSAEKLGVKDIAFIISALVFSLMHLFLTETDLDSVETEINISKKIQKWSYRATSLMKMDEMFRPLLMSTSRVCPRLCVGPCMCWIRSKVFKTVIIYFVVLISALSM